MLVLPLASSLPNPFSAIHTGHGIYVEELSRLTAYEGSFPLFYHIPSAAFNQSIYRSHNGTSCRSYKDFMNTTCRGLALLTPYFDGVFSVLEVFTSSILRRDNPMLRYVNKSIEPEEVEWIQNLQQQLEIDPERYRKPNRGYREIEDTTTPETERDQKIRDFHNLLKKKLHLSEEGLQRVLSRENRNIFHWVWEEVFGFATVDSVRHMKQQTDDVYNYLTLVKDVMHGGQADLIKLEEEVSGLADHAGNSVQNMAKILTLLSHNLGRQMNASSFSSNVIDLYMAQTTMLIADLLTLSHSQTLLGTFLHIQTS